MEASKAAAKLIEDYRGRKRRLGSQKAPQKPTEAKARRLGPLLLLPLLLAPAFLLFPRKSSTGFAVLDGRPLAESKMVATSEDGERHVVSTNQEGDFVAQIPKGTYSFSLEGSEREAVGPKGVKIYPGMNLRVSFSSPPPKGKLLTYDGQ